MAAVVSNNTHNITKLHKHVALIHCRNSLSLLQRKMSNILLATAYHDLDTVEEHSVSIDYLSKKMRFNSKNLIVLKQSLLGLMQKTIEWNLLDKDRGNSWHASTMLASVKIQGPICYYSYSLEMRRLLLHPDMYASIDLKLQSRFKSSYALALYENCFRYVKIGQTPWLSITVFRQLMGVAEHKYARFNSFRERVLDVAINEINNIADIEVHYELAKIGRVVAQIKFKIKYKSNATRRKKFATINTESTGLQLQLEQLGLSDATIAKTLRKYDEQYIKDKIAYIKKVNEQTGNSIKNVASYLNKALQDNYREPQDGVLNVGSSKSEEMDNSAKPDLHAYIKQYLQQKKHDSAIKNALSELPVVQRDKIMQEFVDFLQYKQPVILTCYADTGLGHPLVNNIFMEYFARYQPFMVANILTLQQYHEKI